MEFTLETSLSHNQKTELGIKLVRDLVSNLTLIGFSNEQVIAFVTSIATQKELLTPFEDIYPNTTVNISNYDNEENILWEIEENAAKQDFAIYLKRHQKRVSAANAISDYILSDKDLPRLLNAIDKLDEAYKWYKTECFQKNIILAQSRDVWTLNASDEMLDEEDKILFFDETDVFGDACLYLINRFSDIAAQSGCAEYINTIEAKFSEIEMDIPEECSESIKTGRLKITDRSIFIDLINDIKTNTELPRAELISSILSKTSENSSEGLILDWIENLQESQKLIAFKKSNRWQIRIL